MIEEPIDRGASRIRQGALRAPIYYVIRSIAMLVIAVAPAIICACLAQTSRRWDLFERSGAIVTIIGLLLASRPYLEHSVTDLVVARAREETEFMPDEALDDILAAKRGLTLSAFGTLIWGWGLYVRWWSFSALAIWMVFVVYRTRRDPVLQCGRRRPAYLGRRSNGLKQARGSVTTTTDDPS